MEHSVSHVFSQPSRAVGEAEQSPDPLKFVSAVTWRNTRNVLLAADSPGTHQSESWDDTHVGIQWNLSYLDTLGAEERALISEVS